MAKRGVILAIVCSLILCLSIAFSAFAKEGMVVNGGGNGEGSAIYSYYFEDDTLATNQWRYVWDDWYYFGDDGRTKQNIWAEIDGKWYYFDHWSRMLHNTTTPDGYKLGSDGAWITE